jgi:DNA (cytosine-5)-methyltransferase 1
MRDTMTFDFVETLNAHSQQRLVSSPWKILNLYAGLGGNRKLWDAEVTAVELEPKIADVYRRQHPNDTVIVGDAHEYLLENYQSFDFVWTSPPCQTHSRMVCGHKTKRYADMKLWQEIIFLKHHFPGRWVVENVIPYYDPLIRPTMQVGRHLFWSNFWFTADEVKQPDDFIVLSDVAGKKKLQEWLGIHYEENIYYGDNHCPAQILRNCVHPNLGAQILAAARTANDQALPQGGAKKGNDEH